MNTDTTRLQQPVVTAATVPRDLYVLEYETLIVGYTADKAWAHEWASQLYGRYVNAPVAELKRHCGGNGPR